MTPEWIPEFDAADQAALSQLMTLPDPEEYVRALAERDALSGNVCLLYDTIDRLQAERRALEYQLGHWVSAAIATWCAIAVYALFKVAL